MTIREIKNNAEATIKLMQHLEDIHGADAHVEERSHSVKSTRYNIKSLIVGAVVGESIYFVGQSGVLEAV